MEGRRLARMYCYVWEYQVRSEDVELFLEQYGSDGSWVALFSRAPGYVGTQLLQDRADPGRFLTIDTWETAAAYASFRAQFHREYEQLDRRFAALTLSESHVGDFEVR